MLKSFFKISVAAIVVFAGMNLTLDLNLTRDTQCLGDTGCRENYRHSVSLDTECPASSLLRDTQCLRTLGVELLGVGLTTAHAATNTVLDFDGTSDYVVVADNAVLDQGDRLSLSVWIEPDGTPAGDEYILYRQDAYYIKQTSTNTIVGAIWYSSAWHTVTSSAITADGAAWTHLEMTYDKDAGGTDELKLYINGNLSATGNNSTAIAASDKKLYIGAGDEVDKNNTPEDWFDGQIDDLGLYQYARSASDVLLDYNNGVATHLGPVLKNCSEDPASCMDYGLVGHWGMDEGVGTTAYDSSDNSNDGTLKNGPKWTTDSPPWQGGAGGGSLNFDGKDDYVDCGNDDSLNITDAITIEAWVKPNEVPVVDGTYHYIVSKTFAGSSNNNKSWGLFLTREDGVSMLGYSFQIYKGGSYYRLSVGSNPDIGQWYHLVGVADTAATKMYLYVNGNLIGSKAIPSSLNPGAYGVLIGNAYSSNGSLSDNYFNGTIDEVRIYNRALSAEEVRYHYNKGGPVAEWKFDEGEGTTAFDSSINRNNGTLMHMSSPPTSTSGWGAGKYGSGLNFDGSDDYVDCGNDESLNITDAITIEAWVKTSDNSQQIIVDKNGYDVGYYFRLGWGDGAMIKIDDGTNDASARATATCTDGQWHHIVGVVDNKNTIKIYTDGIEGYITDGVLADVGDISNSKNVYLGHAVTGGSYFNGSIDEVRIYNYARTPSQIQQDYNAGVATHFK